MIRLNVILLSALCILNSCIKEKTSGNDLKPGDRLPEFSVTMSDGRIVTDESLGEGVSCIVFFYTACPDCQKALPEIQKIYNDYSASGVSFVLISREETIDTVLPYWQKNEFSMPFSAQSDRRIYELFATTRVPRVYLVKDGVIMSVFTDDPVPGYDTLSGALRILLE